MCVCMHWQACGGQGGVIHFFFFLRQSPESLIDLEFRQANQAGWTVSSRDPSASVSSVLGLKACASMPNFFCEWWGSNLSPHTRTATLFWLGCVSSLTSIFLGVLDLGLR